MIRKLFSRPARRAYSGPQGSRAYAIGDVHGRLDLLEEVLNLIESDNKRRAEAKVYIIYLGDLIDRGPASRGVIERLLKTPPNFARNIFLKGNHEEFFLSVLNGSAEMLADWLNYGGLECAQSYGITGGFILNSNASEILERLRMAVPADHKFFLEDMADSFAFGDYLFVHAGIRPGVPLDQQSEKDLRWIREGFLDDRSDHGVIVVHGHTIVNDVEEHPNRIAIDTGAYRGGKLTAIGLEGANRWFLKAGVDT